MFLKLYLVLNFQNNTAFAVEQRIVDRYLVDKDKCVQNSKHLCFN